MELQGQTAVVTGAGRGIGRAIAVALAEAGAAVIANDLDAEALDETLALIPGAHGVVAAMGEDGAAEACVDRAVQATGRLDILVANAGILRDRVLWKTSDEDFDAVIATHLRGTFLCARAAARQMRAAGEGGALLLTGSPAGQAGNFGQTAYAAAKAGIAAMARTWSMELARDRIAVNAMIPTAMTRMAATIPSLAPHAEAMARGEPLPDRLRRAGIGTAEDVAPLAVFLASEAGRGITGQCIGLGGDRLSLWSHPAEVAVETRAGGWDAAALAGAWADRLAPHRQPVGLTLPGEGDEDA